MPTKAGKSQPCAAAFDRDEEEASFHPTDVGDAKLRNRVRDMVGDQQSSPEEVKTEWPPSSSGEQMTTDTLAFDIEKESITVDGGNTRTLQISNDVQSLPTKKKKKAKAVE